MANETHWLTASELSTLYRNRSLSPLEVAVAVLERIDKVDDNIHAFLTVAADSFLSSARLAEQALVNGDELGALHGIPIAIKDSIATTGIRTTYGSLLFAQHTPTHDHVAIARLKAAGALVVGKTNVPEFMLISRSSNRLGPECVNPWDTSRTCGGSSGGSGAAVAAGMVPIAIGTDGGGSTRLPAAMNGTFGLYASYGRVPRADLLANQVYPGFPQSGVGPMTPDVSDAATVLQIIAGWDSSDPFSMRAPVPDYGRSMATGVKGLRAEWVTFSGAAAEPATLAVVRSAADLLSDMGVEVADGGEMPPLPATAGASGGRFVSDFVRGLRADPQKWSLLSPITQESVRGPAVTLETEIRGSREREAYLAELTSRFGRADVLISCTMGFPAPKIPSDPFAWPRPVSEMAGATGWVNTAGLTAASVPAGLVEGMPVGLQVIGPRGGEELVLRVRSALEEVRPWAHLHPPV